MTEHVKRVYRSQLREAAAQETRERVLVAAAELFVTRGYPGTTLKEVAERAGVGERTLYDKFGDKFGLYQQTVRYRTRGDDLPVPTPERPEPMAALATQDPAESLELHMGYGADLMERAGDLIMAGITAQGADETLRESFGRTVTSVHSIHLGITRHLESLGALKDGLDPNTAADILHGLSHPALYQSFRRQRRWSQARYRRWLIDVAKQQVLKT